MNRLMRKTAAILGIVAGAIELGLAIRLYFAAGAVKTQLLGDFATGVSIIIPLIMVFAGARFAFNREAWLPAGILVVSWAVQRLMLPLGPLVIASAVLTGAAFVIALYLDSYQRRAEDRQV